MLTQFFYCLKQFGVPVSIREHLDLLGALDKHLVFSNNEEFYYLARTILVKDEKYFDKYDRAFSAFSEGLDSVDGIVEALIPEDWLKSEFLKQLTDEEREAIQSLGDLDKLIEEFKKRLEEQKKRHEGGNKWIGTGGTSPFGNSGFNPEGIRVGGKGGNRKAAKVWDKREYKNLDDSVELGTRNLKMALRRLRKFARTGATDELDIRHTIDATAKNSGLLDIHMVPEKHNAVNVLLFLDVGGSMDPYVRTCEQLFSAAKTEFKHLQYFYFHNFIYDFVWKNNPRRQSDLLPMTELLRTYGRNYKIIFVGDAAMSPYEISHKGGSVEYFNEEAGATWMQRLTEHFDKVTWLNPEPQQYWQHTASNRMVRELIDDKMFQLNIQGLEDGIRYLARN